MPLPQTPMQLLDWLDILSLRSISGAFLAHGLQANRILALDDPDVVVQVSRSCHP
ncbi:hypothetical protein [Brevibacillus brevis]|uniref:hypothetical protein n=1 Tax=Brevibacillus brevis TaxID=1393 RepID=UPI0035A2508B